MVRPDSYSFVRYLAAKESVDDRALHRPTVDRLSTELAARADARDGPVRILEVGCGLGSMLRRLATWGCLPASVSYLGVDLDDDVVAAARERTAAWAGGEDGEGDADDGADGAGRRRLLGGDGTRAAPLELRVAPERGAAADGTRTPTAPSEAASATRVTAAFQAADALTFAEGTDRRFDLVIGAAFFDVVDPEAAIRALGPVAPGGLLYAPITFDGVTAFSPATDPALDDAVVDAYHDTMRGPGRGGPHTGRQLFGYLAAAGGRVLVAGGSDWVVTPPYPDDEGYLLHYLIDTVEGAVREALDEAPAPAVEGGTLTGWADRRHREVAAGSLTFLAHNLDVLARI